MVQNRAQPTAAMLLFFGGPHNHLQVLLIGYKNQHLQAAVHLKAQVLILQWQPEPLAGLPVHLRWHC